VSGEGTEPLRLLVVADGAVARSDSHRLLEAESGWTVETTGWDLDAVVAIASDMLVLETDVPRESLVEAITDVLARSPELRNVVVSRRAEPGYAREALRAGARAFVMDDAVGTELVAAARAVLGGDPYLNPRVGAMLAVERAPSESDGLTRRELEVLRLLALGHTNAEIAARLVLSRRTVDTHRANLQRKLGLSSRAALTKHAIQRGLLEG
jgi:two-component system response regulator NreC